MLALSVFCIGSMPFIVWPCNRRSRRLSLQRLSSARGPPAEMGKNRLKKARRIDPTARETRLQPLERHRMRRLLGLRRAQHTADRCFYLP